MAEVSGSGLDAVAVQALIDQSVPKPASAMPPGVSDSGSTGNAVPYARADHTHASKVRKERRTGIASATFTWTYPAPFAAGVVPIVTAVVEDPANSASDTYNVQVVGLPSATGCVFRITRLTSGLFGLLTGALGFNATPGNINLHCIALEP